MDFLWTFMDLFLFSFFRSVLVICGVLSIRFMFSYLLSHYMNTTVWYRSCIAVLSISQAGIAF